MDSRIIYPELVFNKHPWIEQKFKFNKCFLTDLTIGNQVIFIGLTKLTGPGTWGELGQTTDDSQPKEGKEWEM